MGCISLVIGMNIKAAPMVASNEASLQLVNSHFLWIYYAMEQVVTASASSSWPPW